MILSNETRIRPAILIHHYLQNQAQIKKLSTTLITVTANLTARDILI